jgi:transposase
VLKIADDDVAAPWVLDLWDLAPTPAKARRLRAAPVEKLLKQHRIRRIDAGAVLRNLQEPAIKVADGVAAAASVHLRSLFTRLRVVNRELQQAEAKLDALCAAIGETDADSGDGLQPRDVMILRSMPGIGRTNLATLLCEGSGPLSRRDYQALRTLCGAAPVTKRSGKSHTVIMRYAARPIAQRGLSLGPRRHAARSQEPRPLCRATPARQTARPRPPRCCRPLAWPRLCAAGTTDAIRSGLRPKPSSRRVARSHEAVNLICP